MCRRALFLTVLHEFWELGGCTPPIHRPNAPPRRGERGVSATSGQHAAGRGQSRKKSQHVGSGNDHLGMCRQHARGAATPQPPCAAGRAQCTPRECPAPVAPLPNPSRSCSRCKIWKMAEKLHVKRPSRDFESIFLFSVACHEIRLSSQPTDSRHHSKNLEPVPRTQKSIFGLLKGCVCAFVSPCSSHELFGTDCATFFLAGKIRSGTEN